MGTSLSKHAIYHPLILFFIAFKLDLFCFFILFFFSRLMENSEHLLLNDDQIEW